MAIPPAFADIPKAANDLLNKDFYHTAATNFEVKSKAPNGVNFNVKGKSSHEGKTSGSIEGKYADLANGLTLTQSWTTQNSLDTKVELDNQITKGLKAEVLTSFLPASQQTNARMNLHFKQPNFHTRAFVNLLKGPTATIDATLGHEGFLVGAEAGYDVQKAAITGYAAAVGYSVPQYSAAITATSNLSVFSACYYHKVNPLVEAGAKAVWDSKTSSTVGLEVGGKYRLDPSSFAKVKMNDRGIASAAYSCLIRPGVTLGFGASFDTQAFDKSAPKVGANFVFEG